MSTNTEVAPASSTAGVKPVRLNELFYEHDGVECLAAFQARLSLDREPTCVDAGHVDELCESDHQGWEPIVVTKDPEGYLWIIDGAHRVQAARKLGIRELPAVFEEWPGNDDDAYLRSLQLNLRHGWPITNADRKAWARNLKSQHPDLSERAIAKMVGLSAATTHRALQMKPQSTTVQSNDTDAAPSGATPTLEMISRSWARTFARLWRTRGILFNSKPRDVGVVLAREVRKELEDQEARAVAAILRSAAEALSMQ